MSKDTEEISRRIRRQASEKRGGVWSDADRLTNAYLLLELARVIVYEYSATIAANIEADAERTLELAREAEAWDADEESPQERHDAHEAE